MRALGLLAISVPLLVACGASNPAPRVVSPLTEEAAAAFDNGVDLIGDPTMLEGGWLRSWERDLDQRVGLADAVGLVTVATVQEDVDLERRINYRLSAHVERDRFGGLAGEVDLAAKSGQPGYVSVSSNTERLLNQQFVLFVKWTDEDGRVVPRWHLSPASPAVQRRVNSLLEQRRAPEERRTVIVHETPTEGSTEGDD
jgi:hypothetical protein